MMDAVEQAIQDVGESTPVSGGAADNTIGIQAWLNSSGMQLPTPAAKDLMSLVTAAADNQHLRRQLEALREAELEMAAREAEENAQNFAILEQENIALAADKAELQQRLAALEAQSSQTSPSCSQSTANGLHSQAVAALQRAEDTRRLSGVYQEQQLASFQQLEEAEEQLSAMKAKQPGRSRAQQVHMQERLLRAEQEVEAAAAAAKLASDRLQLVLEEKDNIQEELRAIRQQLEATPQHGQQHGDLYKQLVDVQQALQSEKEHHQRMTSSLLEHAGRLSHKYCMLSDEYGELQYRYDHLASTNDQLSSQLKEAHEALYELHTVVQATPPAKQRENKQLLARVKGAEEAVQCLQQEKTQLHERLMQAQAFIACLQQRSTAAHAPGGRGSERTTPDQPQTVSQRADSAVPQARHTTSVTATAATVTDPTEAPDDFVTPVKGRCNPLFDLPRTPGDEEQQGLQQEISKAKSALADIASQLRASMGTQTSGSSCASEADATARGRNCQGRGNQPAASRAERANTKQPLNAASAGNGSATHSREAPRAAPGSAASSASSGSAKYTPVGAAARHAVASSSSTASGKAAASAAGPPGRSAGSTPSRSSAATSQKRMTAASQARQLQAPAAARSSATSTSTVGAHQKALPGQLSSHNHRANGPGFTFDCPASSNKEPAGYSNADQLRLKRISSAGPDSTSKGVPKPQGVEATAVMNAGSILVTSSKQHISPLSNVQGGSACKATLAGDSACAASSTSKGSISLQLGVSPVAARAASSPASAPCAAGEHTAAVALHTLTQTHDSAAAQNAAVAGSGWQQEQVPGSASGHGEAHHGPVVAAGVQQRSQNTPQGLAARLQGTVSTPHSVVASTGCFAVPDEDVQQGQRAGKRDTAVPTPGSAASSAGGRNGRAGTAAALRAFKQHYVMPAAAQQHAQLLSPCTADTAAAVVGETAPDMQSAVKHVRATAEPAYASLQELLASSLHGAEHVASNLVTGCTLGSLGAGAGHRHLQPGQQELLTPSHDTPTGFARQQAVAEDVTVGNHSPNNQQQELHEELQWPGFKTPGGDARSAPEGGLKGLGGCEASAGGRVAMDRAALVQSAVALLASVGPAGVVGSPAAATPAQIIKQLTPEWMRDLKQRCREGSEQVQQLRQQLGLATPVPAFAVKDAVMAEQQASETAAAVTAVLMAAAVEEDAAGMPQTVQSTEGAHPVLVAAAGISTSLPAPGHQNVADSPDSSCVWPTPVADAGNAATQDVRSCSWTGSAVSQASARGSIDRLRRRAMAQAAAAVSAEAGAAADAEAAAALELSPASVCNSANSELAAELAALAAMTDEELPPCESGGSLAQYMTQQQLETSRAHHGHISSLSNQLLPARPDCPTPGSAFSYTSECNSPDVALLSSLNHSRTVAQQLQERLRHQLNRTASLPALREAPRPRQQGEEALAAGELQPEPEASLGSHPAVQQYAGGTLGAGDPVAANGMVSTAAAAPAAAGQQSGLWQTKPLQGAAVGAPSPITPGAQLNAKSHSQLLSPGAQLRLVFTEEQAADLDGPAAATEEAATLSSDKADQHMAMAEARLAKPDPPRIALGDSPNCVQRSGRRGCSGLISGSCDVVGSTGSGGVAGADHAGGRCTSSCTLSSCDISQNIHGLALGPSPGSPNGAGLPHHNTMHGEQHTVESKAAGLPGAFQHPGRWFDTTPLPGTPVAVEDLDLSSSPGSAAARRAGPVEVVVFDGFEGADDSSSPESSEATAAADGAADPVLAASQTALLQQLLATPASEYCLSPGPLSQEQHLLQQPGSQAATAANAAARTTGSAGKAPVHQQQQAPDTVPLGQAHAAYDEYLAARAGAAAGSSRSAAAPSAAGAGSSAAVRPRPSPTLSELGFIDASLSGNVDSLHLLEQQEEAWLDASTSAQPADHLDPRSSMGDFEHTAECEGQCHGANVASIATQTTPQLLKTASKQAWLFRDMQTQVTPALHGYTNRSSGGRALKTSMATTSSFDTGSGLEASPVRGMCRGLPAGGQAACDVMSSPTKEKDTGAGLK
eukprot:gene2474-2777_t